MEANLDGHSDPCVVNLKADEVREQCPALVHFNYGEYERRRKRWRRGLIHDGKTVELS